MHQIMLLCLDRSELCIFVRLEQKIRKLAGLLMSVVAVMMRAKFGGNKALFAEVMNAGY